MGITIYSLFTAILWFNLFIVLISVLQRKLDLLLRYNFYPIIILIVLTVLRLVAPVETPYTRVLRSTVFLPWLQGVLRFPIVQSEHFSLTVLGGIGIILCLVSAVLVGQYGYKIWREMRLVSSYIRSDDQRLLDIMNRVVQESGRKKSCDIVILDDDTSASIWGLWRPVVLLPVSIQEMSDYEIACILRHEWQHYLERDLWIKFFTEIFRRAMWWNPFIFLLKRDINQSFELKCDLKVTSRLDEDEKEDYLAAIVKLGKLTCHKEEPQPRLLAISLFGAATKKGPSGLKQMEQRFDLVMEHSGRKKVVGTAFTVVFLGLFLSSFLVVVQPFTLPPMEDISDAQLMPPTEEVEVDVYQMPPESSYLIENEDGSYSLYIDEQYVYDIPKDEMQNLSYWNIPIVEKERIQGE